MTPFSRDLLVREPTLTELVARAHHLLSDSFHDLVKGYGLSPTEWRVLSALHERDGVTMTDLAEHVLFKQPTLTKAVDRMERAQLVQRRTPSEDRRRTLVLLTERGRRVSAPLVTRASEHAAAVDRIVGDTASRELRAGLASLIELLAQLSQELRQPRNGPQSPGALPD